LRCSSAAWSAHVPEWQKPQQRQKTGCERSWRNLRTGWSAQARQHLKMSAADCQARLRPPQAHDPRALDVCRTGAWAAGEVPPHRVDAAQRGMGHVGHFEHIVFRGKVEVGGGGHHDGLGFDRAQGLDEVALEEGVAVLPGREHGEQDTTPWSKGYSEFDNVSFQMQSAILS